ncbi:MAG: TIGR03960 family B12-binding radical SAM protein, partial [Deltaproteobacteria bacterium]|nr:TIGR03960 family B12-binding radical SAM protein [Deltaproteobacteria bacterium]
MSDLNIFDYLPLVRKPSRYIGGEVNSIKKDLSKVRLKFGLGFPDVYEVGMSHLGIQILYQALNSRDDTACERVFAPWPDMEALLREKKEPLTTLESGIPLNSLDIMGFSLQYELSYTNVLNMLELGGIPLYARERSEKDPLVIGGGHLSFNPEPVSSFFDCFLIGDGEEAVMEICDAVIEGKDKGLKRKELLESLSRIEGVYVPAFFEVIYNPDSTVREIQPLRPGYGKVRKRTVKDLNLLPSYTRPVVPFALPVHDRLSIEIARGCTRGCRFCQAGMLQRPLRERDPEKVIALAEESLKNTGYEEVSLLSLSTGDYSSIEGLLCRLADGLADKRIAMSLPSLRVGTLNARVASEIKRVRKTGFTLAPEAGTARLRRVINKGIEESELIEGAREIFNLGWRSIKLYFMIGLPTEKMDDVMEIIRLSKEVREEGKKVAGRNPDVNASVATFVPKPHTPFQWEPQITPGEGRERLVTLKKEAGKANLGFKWHDWRMSLVEGVFSRGDRRLGKVLVNAFRKGCRFDGWSEEFKWERWEGAFREEGVAPAFYTGRRRAREEVFPWDHLESGVTKEHLYKEYENALKSVETPDCRAGRCTLCGVCDFKTIRNVMFRGNRPGLDVKGVIPKGLSERKRIRFGFSKTGRVRFLSHLELARAVARAIRRAGIPVTYSAGFHPLPEIVFSDALPVGMESMDEHMDVILDSAAPLGVWGPERLATLFNSVLPEGLKVLSAQFIPLQLPSLSAIIRAQKYIVFLKNGPLPLDIEYRELSGLVRDFLLMDSIEVT